MAGYGFRPNFNASRLINPYDSLQDALGTVRKDMLAEEALEKSDARQAGADERQDRLDARADLVFNQGQKDRKATEAFRAERAKGPQVLAGVITGAVESDPSVMKGIELTEAEQAVVQGYNAPDGGYDFEALRADKHGDLVDKLVRQQKLSGLVDNKAAKENRVQQLERSVRGLTDAGYAIPDEAVTALDQARIAQATIEKDNKKAAQIKSEDMRKEGVDLNRALAKARDKYVTSGGKLSYTPAQVAKNRSDISQFIADAVKSKDIDYDRRDTVARNAKTQYDDLVKDGIDPVTAKDIIQSSIRATPDKWYTFGGKIKMPQSTIQKLKSDALRSQAVTGRGMFSGGGFEIEALKKEAIDYADRSKSARSDLAQSLLSPEERQYSTLLEGLDRGVTPVSTTAKTSGDAVDNVLNKSGVQAVSKDNIEEDQEGVFDDDIVVDTNENAKEVFEEQKNLLASKNDINSNTDLSELEKSRELDKVDAKLTALAETLPLDKRIGNRARALLDSTYQAPISLDPLMEPITAGLSFMIRSGVRDANLVKDNIAVPLGDYLKSNKPSKESKDMVAEAISSVLPGKDPFKLTEGDKKSLANGIANRYDKDPDSFLKSPLGTLLIGINNKLRGNSSKRPNTPVSPKSRQSFFERSQSKLDNLKRMGFTDAQIKEASDEILREGIPYTRT